MRPRRAIPARSATSREPLLKRSQRRHENRTVAAMVRAERLLFAIRWTCQNGSALRCGWPRVGDFRGSRHLERASGVRRCGIA